MNEHFFYFSVLLTAGLAVAGMSIIILAFIADIRKNISFAALGAFLACAGIACSYITGLFYDDMVVRCEKCGHIIFIKD